MSNYLHISPGELFFPLQQSQSRLISVILKLENTTDTPVAFKVKTTAPKRYCVRPNAGIVKVGDTKSVEVVLQPNKQPGSTDTKKDKFLVQCIPVAAGTEMSNSEVGDLMKAKSKDPAMQSKKLKCHYRDADTEEMATPVSEKPDRSGRASVGGGGADTAALKSENSDLKKEVATLRGELKKAKRPTAPKAAPAKSGYSLIVLIIVALLFGAGGFFANPLLLGAISSE